MPEQQLDLRVHDRVALDEIELYTEVLSAVAASDRPLTAAELDDVLGVSPVPVSIPLSPIPLPRASRVPEHDVGVPAGEAQRLVQPDRRRIRLVHIEHDPDQAPGS
jgi:hypothetical protein